MIKSVEYILQPSERFIIASRGEMILVFCVSETSTFCRASFYYSQELLIWVEFYYEI